MFGYIYKTTNNINNKIYIGQKKSSTFISTYFGSGKLIKKALKKYSKDNFTVEVLCWCKTKDELNERERYWIKNLNSRNSTIGYNLAEGGEGNNGGGFKGKHHTLETKKLLSIAVSKANEKRVGKKMIDIVGPDYINGMKGKPACNKGKIKIYNKITDKLLYINKEDLSKYPDYRIGGRTHLDKTLDLSYLNNPGYKDQLKKRFQGTKFIHNDFLKKCKRIREKDIDKYIVEGWILGRKIYNL